MAPTWPVPLWEQYMYSGEKGSARRGQRGHLGLPSRRCPRAIVSESACRRCRGDAAYLAATVLMDESCLLPACLLGTRGRGEGAGGQTSLDVQAHP